MIIGIDLSLRSSGIVAIDMKGNLIDFAIIASRTGNEKTKKYSHLPVKNDEELLIYNSKTICGFIGNLYGSGHNIKGAIIEGLSYGGVSGAKDAIYGNFWYLRCELKKAFKYLLVGVVPVSAWRSKVIPKSENKELTEKYGKKLRFKQGCVDKLPAEIKEKFEKYIKENGLKKECLFDLADAFFIANYRLGLEE